VHQAKFRRYSGLNLLKTESISFLLNKLQVFDDKASTSNPSFFNKGSTSFPISPVAPVSIIFLEEFIAVIPVVY